MNILPVYGAGLLAKSGMATFQTAAAGFANLLSDARENGSAAPAAVATNDRPARPNFTVGSSSPLSSSEGKSALDRLLELFRERLGERLEEEDVPLDGPLQLQLDAFGRVEVAGQHPEKRRIEQLIEADPALSEMFATLAEQWSRLQESDENPATLRRFALLVDRQGAVVLPDAAAESAAPPTSLAFAAK